MSLDNTIPQIPMLQSDQTSSQKLCLVQSNTNNSNATITNTNGAPLKLSSETSADDNRTNLIINYLPQTMTQEEIRTLFSSVGELESCKLIRDKQTGQSLGYGFVNYKRPEDADKAVTTLNQLRIQNKIIKVSLARPSNESIKGANVYISGLPRTMTQLDLETLFGGNGTIISSRILTDPSSGISKGVGFIRFDKRCEAEKAIESLNGHTPSGSTEKITVKFANTPSSKNAAPIPMALAASYLSPVRQIIGPIHHAAGRFSSLYRFSPFDTTGLMSAAAATQPTATPIALAPATPAATPTYAATPAAPLPVTAINTPYTQPVTTTSVASQGWTLFVCNLPPETDERTLWQLFGPFGAVLSVKIIHDIEKCKGYGFVTMAEYQQAVLAIARLNGFTIGDRTLQVTFKNNGMRV